MDEYITDPELLKQLNGVAETAPAPVAPPAAESGYITDPALLNQLNAPTGAVAPGDITAGPAGYAAPALTGAAYGVETGLPQLAQTVKGAVSPVVAGAGNYLKNPMNILTDVALTHMGAPPVAGMAKLYDAYKGVKQVAGNLNEALSKLPEQTLAKIKPAGDYLSNALLSKDINALDDAIKLKGAGQAIKELQLPTYLKDIPEAKQALNEIKGAFPGTMGKIGAVAGPLVRGASRVLGPAGMAMDIYDAAKYAQEAGFGQRLAQGEGARGMQAFQNLNNQNVSGYMLSPVEAKNVLASGDERTINMYGGRQRLEGIVSAPNAINSGFTNQLNTLSR